MLRYFKIVTLIILALLSSLTCFAGDVTVTETTISIPTYAYEQGQYTPLPQDKLTGYPYPTIKLYEVAQKPAPRNYRTIVLENDYLKLTMLPDLGGRIHQLIYKPTNQSVFYENEVMKPNQFAEQGWWMSTGGMEFCFPLTEHSTNILRPWVYSIQKHSDGSATVTVSDTHQRTGLSESVSITLVPNSCALKFHIRLNNAGYTAKPFVFWMNPMFPANDEIEFIVPTDKMINWDQSLNDWPFHDGKDYSKLVNWKEYSSQFAAKLKAGYAGMYDHTRDLGMVRAFPLPEVRGVKIFSFGHSDEPSLKPQVYTDSGKPYFEMWGGYNTTFWDNTDLKPHSVIEWEENWYPVAQTDGFKSASRDLAVNAKIDHDQVKLTFFASRDIKNAKVALGSGGQIMSLWREDFECGKPINAITRISPHTGPAYVDIYEGSTKLLHCILENPKPHIAKQPKPDEKKQENIQANQQSHRRKKQPEEPQTVASLMAKDRVAEAIKLYESDTTAKPGASMNYAVALVRAGRYDDALTQLNQIKSNELSEYISGTLLLRKGDAAGARSKFDSAVKYNPKDARAYTALAVTWASEDSAKAKSYLNQALSLDCNNLLALAELSDLGDEQAKAKLSVAFLDGAQNAAYISLDYLELNQLAKSEIYARKAIEAEPSNITARAALIVSLTRAGKKDAANEALQQLNAVDIDKSITYGSDASVSALEEALRAKPESAYLMVYLASACQTRSSEDMALSLAKSAADLDSTIARAYFIQAQVLSRKARREDKPEMTKQAVKLVDKTLALKPQVIPYYYLGSWIYERANRYYASVDAMRQLNKMDPSCQLAYDTLAWYEIEENNDYEAAIGWFSKLIGGESNRDGQDGLAYVYRKWVQVLAHEGKYQEAADKLPLADSLKMGHSAPAYYVAEFDVLKAIGKEAEARTLLEKIAPEVEKNVDEHPYYAYYAGCILDRLGEKDKAKSMWEKCKAGTEVEMKEEPDNDFLKYLLALSLKDLGQPKEALEVIKPLHPERAHWVELKMAYEDILAAVDKTK